MMEMDSLVLATYPTVVWEFPDDAWACCEFLPADWGKPPFSCVRECVAILTPRLVSSRYKQNLRSYQTTVQQLMLSTSSYVSLRHHVPSLFPPTAPTNTPSLRQTQQKPSLAQPQKTRQRHTQPPHQHLSSSLPAQVLVGWGTTLLRGLERRGRLLKLFLLLV